MEGFFRLLFNAMQGSIAVYNDIGSKENVRKRKSSFLFPGLKSPRQGLFHHPDQSIGERLSCYHAGFCSVVAEKQSEPGGNPIYSRMTVPCSRALLIVLLALILSVAKAGDREVSVLQQEFTVQHYPAEGQNLVIWIASGYGSNKRVFAFSQALAEQGIEVWHVDLAESLFLPRGTATMRSLRGNYVAGLIALAHRQTGKNITLISSSYGALPVLRGARHWQSQQAGKPATYFDGVILFSPDLYSGIPALGQAPVFDPVVEATSIPVMLYQDALRGNRWQLQKVVDKLRRGGSRLYIKILPGVTSLFYPQDRAAATLSALKSLPAEISGVIRLLHATPTPVTALPLPQKKPRVLTGMDTALKPYRGQTRAWPLDLPSVKKGRIKRQDYRGRVTLVNFWASWCPPCVQEIPSLNHLRKRMQGKKFELISVNYAQSRQQVTAFLQKVDVDFPVLLDEDGRTSAKWKVLVYPSTFVIGPDGRIRYGVNAAIHWDSPEVVKKLEALMRENP